MGVDKEYIIEHCQDKQKFYGIDICILQTEPCKMAVERGRCPKIWWQTEREGEPQMDELQFAKQCHKPSSLYYRCYCDERKEDEYCNGCRFWYESQTERSK